MVNWDPRMPTTVLPALCAPPRGRKSRKIVRVRVSIIRNASQAADARADGVERGARGNEQGLPILSAENQLQRTLGDLDGVDEFAGGVVDIDLAGGNVDVASFIDGDAFAALVGEELPVGQVAVRPDRGGPGGQRGFVGEVIGLARNRARQSKGAYEVAALDAPTERAVDKVLAGGEECRAVGRNILIGPLGRLQVIIAHRQHRGHTGPGNERLGFEKGDFPFRGAGLEGVDGAVPGVADDDQVARFVKCKVDGVERAVADGGELAGGGRPAIDSLPLRIDEIEVSRGIDGASGNVVEAAGQLLSFGARGEHRGRGLRKGTRRVAGDGQPGNFPLADFDVVRLVVNRGVERHLAVAVAVDVAQAYVAGVGDFDGPRERLKGADHAVAVKVGDGNVAGPVDFERQRETAFAALLLGLQRVDLPLGDVVQLHLVSDMRFAGDLRYDER